MSDSAGFQVFSLGSRSPEQSEGRRRLIQTSEDKEPLLLKISDDGVLFRSSRDGKEVMFTPEISMRNQEKIGADILMAFDECIPSGVDYTYTKQATQRTHNWLVRCIQVLRQRHSAELSRSPQGKQKKDQRLCGIIQGGVFKDLRIQSAQFVREQNIDGIAIGGVSVGETKKEMEEQVNWVAPYLPGELPRHLLGIGRIEDILKFVKLGVDTFDCAEPTRLGRNGIVFGRVGKQLPQIDLTKARYVKNKSSIQKNCACYTCQNFSLSFLHHLFKERELLGYFLATYHNLFFFEKIFRELREKITQEK